MIPLRNLFCMATLLALIALSQSRSNRAIGGNFLALSLAHLTIGRHPALSLSRANRGHLLLELSLLDNRAIGGHRVALSLAHLAIGSDSALSLSRSSLDISRRLLALSQAHLGIGGHTALTRSSADRTISGHLLANLHADSVNLDTADNSAENNLLFSRRSACQCAMDVLHARATKQPRMSTARAKPQPLTSPTSTVEAPVQAQSLRSTD